ncbi:molybdenum ABC transporter ATP-binding protein ModC [Marinobacterium jannaschii]|uniref:molybdenum ABC transporter ATP-binding protein ModC n=1 Tax=Marinobacterium jannaschii TaxID=64970 RepID=UPI00047F8B5D|nr:molybdenum ABC transporter ATP-binding protein ModC [Marinobacterium jannaschii]
MLKLELQHQQGAFSLDAKLVMPNQGITAIFGRSGAGKTTLINLISGLETPQSGLIELNGKPLLDTANKLCLPPEKRRIGYVFQDARLFPHYSVRGNLNYGRKDRSDAVLFETITQLLGIETLLERYPARLSGGEKQRVAIGRALLSEPELLLLDEPLASLDLPRKRELLPYLEKLAQEVRIPILYVSHSLDEILHLADNMVLMDKGEVVLNGPVERLWGSAALQPWFGPDVQSSLLPTQLSHHHADYPMSCLQLGSGEQLWVPKIDAQPGAAVRVRIYAREVSLARSRPEDSSIRNILPAKIRLMQREASRIQVLLTLGEAELWAYVSEWAAADLQLKPGEEIFAQIKSVSVTRNDWASL